MTVPKKKLKPDGSHGGGRPTKDAADSRQYTRNRNLTRSAAEITRQHGVPLELIAEFQNAVLAGHSSATIQQDDDGDWYVTWEEGELASTLEQKQRAAEFLVQRGYGMPAQTVHVEQEMRITSNTTNINVGVLPPAAVMAIAALRQSLLSASTEPEPAEDLPASTVETPRDDDDPNIEDAELVEPEPDLDPDAGGQPA